MALSNRLVYSGAMTCGSQTVASAKMSLPKYPNAVNALSDCAVHDWLLQVWEPPDLNLAASKLRHTYCRQTNAISRLRLSHLPHFQALDPDRRVVFLDTSGLPGSSELLQGDGVSNPGEASVVGLLLRGLLASGAAASDIGLVSPYRAQVGLMRFQGFSLCLGSDSEKARKTVQYCAGGSTC